MIEVRYEDNEDSVIHWYEELVKRMCVAMQQKYVGVRQASAKTSP